MAVVEANDLGGAPDKNSDMGQAAHARRSSVTLRAVLLGIVLLPVNAYWVVCMEIIRYSAHPTTLSLFFNCVFELVVLTLINSAVRRLNPRLAFSQGELLLVYSMLGIGTALCGHDMIQILIPMIAAPVYLSDGSNHWNALFGNLYPHWLTLQDPDSAKDFFQGNSTLYTTAHLRSWAVPVLAWTSFLVVLLYLMQCVNTILRKQWADNERLSFPLVRLPLEITSGFGDGASGPPLMRSRIFWIGFALAAGIDIINSISYYHPAIPSILSPGGNGLAYYQWDATGYPKPWNALGRTPISFFPFVIGLGMLMPLDFLFSLVFFFIFWKLQSVFVVAMAWDFDNKMPYANYQSFGAYFFFCVSSIYLARQYLGQVFRLALGMPSTLDDSAEPVRYRTALIGMFVAFLALVGFAIYIGLSPWLAVLFFLIYLGLAVAITRMRAELGTPIHDLHNSGPDLIITDVMGAHALRGQDLGAFSMFFFLTRAYRSHPMPVQLEALKMADAAGAPREMRRWFWVLILAGAVGALSAMWAMLHLSYQFGALGKAELTAMHAYSYESWSRLASWLQTPKAGNDHVLVAGVVGFLFAAFLQLLRIRMAAFPFHPLAFAVSSSFEINFVWMPILIAWMTKSLMLRYGGVKTYQAWLPFFYGLILGQFIEGSLLNIWGIATGSATYQFWQ
ncbi:MAG: hypothetical protein P4L33_11380 [Capsulimonadaceae bacterium]|nr:hypothetical protein [Capsulimonadaceae bacterium]